MDGIDILGRKLTGFAGSFALDDALLTFPNLPDVAGFIPYIVTQLQAQYAQQITRLYGINKASVLLAAGRPQGNGSLNQILAPDGNLSSFYKTYGDVCNAAQNLLQFTLKNGCGGRASATNRFTMGTVVIEQLGIAADAQSSVVNNSFSVSYQSLQYA